MAYEVGKYVTEGQVFTYWHAGDRCFAISHNPDSFVEFDSWEKMSVDMKKHNLIHPWLREAHIEHSLARTGCETCINGS